MARGYRYADAVRLLGGADPAVKTLDTLLGAGTLGVWDLIEAKNELIKVGNDLLGRWRERRSGQSWRSRTERLEAAHAIVVVTAYLETLGMFKTRIHDLGLTRDEQRVVLRMRDIPCPAPHRPFERNIENVAAVYQEFGSDMVHFLEGLAPRATEHEWEATVAVFRSAQLVGEAVRRYADRFRQLTVDVPEFAFWAGEIEHQATRAGLAELARLLTMTASGGALPEQLDTLARLHRAAITRSVARTGHVPEGMTMPTLEQAYITPRYRVAQVSDGDDPSVESWWHDLEVQEDLAGFLARFLTNPAAVEGPLVVLGQPGAGKSVLTKVLAARLPENSFLPIRVPLREVSANGDLQEQVEQAVYRLSGERLSWPEIARGAAGVLPVVILDGFDELLQATGVRQTDYLERVAAFQQREVDAGRALAVIVTSRTAVAHRARMPTGTYVAKLEPFDVAQIGRWLKAWNETNAGYFQRKGLSPLTYDVLRRQAALAAQPLLLLMLALHDADGNALHNAAELGEAELYERLVKRFVERELGKSGPDAGGDGQVERELVRLECVAFSMFNRGRQWATSEEFDQDLKALKLDRVRAEAGFAVPLSAGDLAPGRFFFVHEDRATQDDQVLQTYEFLHATFGEFLIARFVASLLDELCARQRFSVMGEIEDGRLRALLSWATLSTRVPVLRFLEEMARAEWRPLVVRLFRTLEEREETVYPYRPWNGGPQRRYAYYSANLLLLALACGQPLQASALLPGYEPVIQEWRRHALLWRSQCAPEEWTSLVEWIAVKPQPDDVCISLNPGLVYAGPDDLPEMLPDPLLDRRDAVQLVAESVFSYDCEQMALLQATWPFIREALPGNDGAPLRGLLDVLYRPVRASEEHRDFYGRAIEKWTGHRPLPIAKAILGDLAMDSEYDPDVIIGRVAETSDTARGIMEDVAALRRRLLRKPDGR